MLYFIRLPYSHLVQQKLAAESHKTDAITAHVLDTSKGTPVAGIKIHLLQEISIGDNDSRWKTVSETVTNLDGRSLGLAPVDHGCESIISVGVFKLIFETEPYFAASSISTFYPRVEVIFRITDPKSHYHIPLLISPFGYSTYRGS